jgi:hypothetical protein
MAISLYISSHERFAGKRNKKQHIAKSMKVKWSVQSAICRQPDTLPRCQETAEWLTASRSRGCPPSTSSRLLTVRRALRVGG